MELIQNSRDFVWLKRGIDFRNKREYDHVGEPERYPCYVESENDNGANWMQHTFIYLERVECAACGHTEMKWPQSVAADES